MRIPIRSHCYHFSLATLFLFCFGVPGFAQINWVPDSYYGIPERDKQSAFWDEFENNAYQWDLGSLYLNERIEDGDFYCASLTPHTYTKRRRVPMNQSGNYEIEIRMRFVKGSERNLTGLTFGRDVRGNEYNFFFNSRGNFQINKFDRGRSTDLIGWTKSEHLSKYSYNSLMVRKVANEWFFFINHELVAQMNAQQLFGNEFGFTIGGHMAVEVDNLRISEIRTVDTEGPKITLIQPQLDENNEAHFKDRKQIIRGKIFDVSGGVSLAINHQPITVASDGTFTASVSLLDNGPTYLQLEARDAYENISNQDMTMYYQESRPMAYSYSTPVSQQEMPGFQRPAPGSGFSTNKGKNYVLLIGVNQYNNWTPLHNAVKDCEDITETLTTYYDFDPQNVIRLFNEEATRENILETFESLQETLNEEDNLLIYYAGHGYYDEISSLGYWVPVNARLNKIPDFLRNSTIHDYLRTINTKHTLLIADACYAGSLFATYRGGNLSENNKSRWAFTSGDIEKVWDGQPGQNSPFARYLIRYLRNNTRDELPANELIESVGAVVERNTAQSPQGSSLARAGDEGGVFVFRRR